MSEDYEDLLERLDEAFNEQQRLLKLLRQYRNRYYTLLQETQPLVTEDNYEHVVATTPSQGICLHR